MSKRLRALLLAALGSASPSWAQSIPATPPSPFEGGHGVYDRYSHCWVWERGDRHLPPSFRSQTLVSGIDCGGKPLNGDNITMRWHTGVNGGETWQGRFEDGRFTGVGTARYQSANAEYHYVAGLREGPAKEVEQAGGMMEFNYAADRQDGPFRQVYADGGETMGQFTKGAMTGTWSTVFPDKSRIETVYDADQPPAGNLIAADGKRVAGNFVRPRLDPTNPPFAYPPIAIRLGQQGTVRFLLKVKDDGSIQEAHLVRPTPYPELDEVLKQQVAAWKCIPATLDGKPVPAQHYLTISLSFATPRNDHSRLRVVLIQRSC